MENILQTLQNNTKCVIINIEGDRQNRTNITITGSPQEQEVPFTVDTGFSITQNIEYTYAELNEPIYSEETQIEILNSTNEEKLPTGLFLVDTRQEVVNYIRLMTEAQQAVPTSESSSRTVPTFDNLNNKVADNTIYFIYNDTDIIMQFKGMYSKVYKEGN